LRRNYLSSYTSVAIASSLRVIQLAFGKDYSGKVVNMEAKAMINS
jgi:hypothetical protein